MSLLRKLMDPTSALFSALHFWGQQHRYTDKVFEFSRSVFPVRSGTKRSKARRVVLSEFTQIPEQHIALLAFIDVLDSSESSHILGFRAGHIEACEVSSLAHRLAHYITKFLPKSLGKLSYHLGYRGLVTPYRRPFIDESQRISSEFFGKAPTLSDIEGFAIRGIQIGDLIYDGFLREKSVPTIDPQSSDFLKYFRNAVCLYLFWERYFAKNRVSVFIGSNVYLQAIPQRIATESSVAVFDVQGNRVHKVEPGRRVFSEFSTLAQDFRVCIGSGVATSSTVSEELSESILSGDGSFAAHLPRSGPHSPPPSVSNLPEKSLIAFIPSLRDSPHTFGQQAFPDAFQWFRHLCIFSNTHNLPLFFKVHPVSPEDSLSLGSLKQQFPRLEEIPPNFPSSSLLDSEPSVVLSIRGHIALEAGLRGLPVALAGENNPYVSFGFASCAKTPTHHSSQILQLLEHPPARTEVIERTKFALAAIQSCYPDDVLIPNYRKTVSEQKALGKPWRIYDEASRAFSTREILQTRSRLDRFINSDRSRLSPILCD